MNALSDMKLFPFSQQQTNSWSGGTTTELFIFPATASYADRNFDFRISTATVESETSDFTELNGFSRYLMVLEGEMIIRHEERYEKQLHRFDFDEFEGSWKTQSAGKVRDFNIIYRPELNISVTFRDCRTSFEIEKQNGHHFLFLLDDSEPQIAGQLLQRYDLLEIQENIKLEVTSKNAHFLEILIR